MKRFGLGTALLLVMVEFVVFSAIVYFAFETGYGMGSDHVKRLAVENNAAYVLTNNEGERMFVWTSELGAK